MSKIETRKSSKGNSPEEEFFSPHGLAPSHRDFELLRGLEQAILRHSGGYDQFQKDIPQLLRQAIDEVIDAPRSKRFTIAEIEKTEKTYLGTKVEILLRNYLGVPKGLILDLLIDRTEVDVKNTIGSSWTIPHEAMGHPCILIKANEQSSKCSFGIIVIREEVLNKGLNQDKKTTIKSSALINVHWMLLDAPYPPNFWQHLDVETREAIMSPRGGTDRLAVLFRKYQGRPISRTMIRALAQQEDPMRRVRKNGGARDPFREEGIALLSGKTDRLLIQELGLPFCKNDEFISILPRQPHHINLLRNAKKII